MTLSWQVVITVFTLGGIGAVIRALVLMILGVSSLFYFPIGVLLINLLAAFLGGFVVSLALPEALHSVFVIGLLGGIGTLSAICSDVIDLYYDRIHRKVAIVLGIAYLVLSTVLGMLCAQGGIALSTLVLDEQPRMSAQEREQRIDDMIKQLEVKHDLNHVSGHQLPQLTPPAEAAAEAVSEAASAPTNTTNTEAQASTQLNTTDTPANTENTVLPTPMSTAEVPQATVEGED